MTPEQIELVERTLAEARPALNRVLHNFYARLHAADPAIAAMFTKDPARQRERFGAELRVIATSIRRHDAFVAEVRELGMRHAGYGVRASHYRTAGPLLLDALAAALGARWTAEAEEAWRLAYNLTFEAMMAGAAESVSQVHCGQLNRRVG
jgi:hemoglobin-like flavoprotein